MGLIAWNSYGTHSNQIGESQTLRLKRKKLNSSLNNTPSDSVYRTTNLTEALAMPSPKSGKGIVRSDLITFAKSFLGGAESKNLEKWEQYKRAYLNVETVAASIDTMVDNAIQTFHIVGDNEANVNTIKDLVEKFDLVEFFHNVAKQMLIFGNSFVELVTDETDGIVDLKILNPISIFVNRNEFGNFETNQSDAYLQFIPHKPMAPINFAFDEIVHFKWNPVGESAYGNSIISPVLRMLQLKINLETNMDITYERYAAPLIHFKVGTPERPTSQKEINAISSDLEDIQIDTELVTDDRVEGKVLGTEGETLNFEPPLKYAENLTTLGLQTPAVILGNSDVDRAAAEVQLDMFDRKAKVLQRAIKRKAEMFIFRVHLNLMNNTLIEDKDIPKLVWGEPEQRQDREDIRLILDMVDSGVITPQKANSLFPDEYQEQLPEELKNPSQFNQPSPFGDPNQPGNPKKEEPSVDRIKTGRDKRIPKEKRKENHANTKKPVQ